MMKNRYTFFNYDLVFALGYLLLCFLTYSNSLHNDFLMDDYPMLIQNTGIGNTGFLQLDPQSGKGQLYFRPLTHFLNLITYTFFGNSPFGYHIVNLFLFYLAGVTLYELLLWLFNDRKIAILVSLFFCTHPINGVLVNYKNATSYALLVVAINLSLIHQFMISDKRSKFMDYSFSAVWFVVALLCHEIAMVYPLYLVSALFFSRHYSLKQIFLRCRPFFVILIFYLVFRMTYASLGTSVISKITTSKIILPDYFATVTTLIFWYIQKLLTLQGIVLIWDTTTVQGQVVLWNFALGVSIVIIYFLMRYCWRGEKQSLALSWFVLGILPVSFACFSRPWFGFIIEPHWLIYASIGFFILLAVGLDQLYALINKKLWACCLVALTIFFVVHSRQYNYLWGNQIRYCQYWSMISPNNFMPQFWLGHGYLETKNYKMAKVYFEKLLERGITYEWTYGNLGLIEYHLKNYDQAIHYFTTTLRANPQRADTYYYLGLIYFENNDFGKAKKFFMKALELDDSLFDSKQKLELIEKKQKAI